MKRTATISLLALSLMANSASAQITETRLTASAGIQFGGSVSIAGDIAIVGVSLTNANAAYSFRLDGADWAEQGMLIPGDGVDAEAFGTSVATSGAFAIVGAPLFDYPSASNGGAAYLFRRDGDSWTEQNRVGPSDVDGQDDAGTSVAISGDYAIVGSHKHNDLGLNSGAAYIFVRSGESWVEQTKLLASDGAQDDEFGFSVSISGDYAIVGAWQDNDGAGGAGSAYVFLRNDTTWIEQAKLTASDPSAGASFGIAVSISGDYAIIGAPVANGNAAVSGAAYIFKREGENWVEEDKLTASDGVSSDFFGGSVAIDGSMAIVGAFNSAGIVEDAGSAYVFQGQNGDWTEIAKLSASDGAASDLFGTSVSISGDCAIVGAEADDGVGSAYTYCGLSTVVSVDDFASAVPEEFSLEQNYPNPFNPETAIRYDLPEATKVQLRIHNMLGQEVRTLVNDVQPAGQHRVVWDGRDGTGVLLTSGIYVYRISTEAFATSRKMILLR